MRRVSLSLLLLCGFASFLQ